MSTGRQRRHILLISSSLTVMLFLLAIFRPAHRYQELDIAFIEPKRRVGSHADGWSSQVEESQDYRNNFQELLVSQQILHEKLEADQNIVHVPKNNSQSPAIESVVQNNEKDTKLKSKKNSTKKDVPIDPSTAKMLSASFLSRLRMKVRSDFANIINEFDFDPGSKIDMKISRKVLLLSTFRSGSSFTGELLSSYPGSFYSFEPLYQILEGKHYQGGSLDTSVHNLIKDILTCSFENQKDYLGGLEKNGFMIFNKNLWDFCARNRQVCHDPQFVSEACQHLPLNIMKTARLGVKPVRALMEDPSLDLRVIHLVRDPRGTMNSRYPLKWCTSKSCAEPDTVCKDLSEDLDASKEFSTIYPDRYMMVRYEDLSLNTAAYAKQIFDFLGLSSNRFIEKFVADHSSAKKTTSKNAYTTFRNSASVTFAWRQALSFTKMEEIQNVCTDPLHRLGYRIFRNEKEYSNSTLSVI